MQKFPNARYQKLGTFLLLHTDNYLQQLCGKWVIPIYSEIMLSLYQSSHIHCC